MAPDSLLTCPDSQHRNLSLTPIRRANPSKPPSSRASREKVGRRSRSCATRACIKTLQIDLTCCGALGVLRCVFPEWRQYQSAWRLTKRDGWDELVLLASPRSPFKFLQTSASLCSCPYQLLHSALYLSSLPYSSPPERRLPHPTARGNKPRPFDNAIRSTGKNNGSGSRARRHPCAVTVEQHVQRWRTHLHQCHPVSQHCPQSQVSTRLLICRPSEQSG